MDTTNDDYPFIEDTDRRDAPALFLFHGTGGNEHQFFAVGDDLLPGARRISPRGDVLEGGAPRFFRRLGEGRYDMADLDRATGKMARFVEARVAAGRPAEVLSMGYSNGANILASVLFERPELFDAVVLAHPLIPFAPVPQPGLAGKRVLITAGRYDPIAPGPLTERLASYLREQGAKTEVYWHDGGHELRPGELVAMRRFLRSGGQAKAVLAS